jgi:hypothetical protein
MTVQVLVLELGAAWALLVQKAGKAASNRANTAKSTEGVLGRTVVPGMRTPSQFENL